ncbi:hypothetical protein LZ31DRAFT_28685 [Colletotrichum somersetense]|nr:hypothetical protein LZ31DRAFT_28685 [Colletotrichum somersetense]
MAAFPCHSHSIRRPANFFVSRVVPFHLSATSASSYSVGPNYCTSFHRSPAYIMSWVAHKIRLLSDCRFSAFLILPNRGPVITPPSARIMGPAWVVYLLVIGCHIVAPSSTTHFGFCSTYCGHLVHTTRGMPCHMSKMPAVVLARSKCLCHGANLCNTCAVPQSRG